MTDPATNLHTVRAQIEAAVSACGRKPGSATLLAITKTFPVDVISAAIAAGQRRFGENRVQEAEDKIRHFKDTPGLEWHLVGHLQSNKARRAAELFDVIHSVDSLKLARRLSDACVSLEKTVSVFIQADLAHEATKFGLDAGRVPELVDDLLGLPGLRLDGLMTIPPFFEDPEETRPFFARLRELRETLEARRPGCLGAGHLSMGMTHDFEVAIQEGATILRIGTALFGER